MGYTHYWDKKGNFNTKKFAEFTNKVKKIVEAIDTKGPIGGVYYLAAKDAVEVAIDIAGGAGEKGSKPILNDNEVCFNGLEDNSHESFYIQNRDDSLDAFSFCKTARKPYDIAVTASLIAFKHTFAYGTKISSDGNIDEWADGLSLYNRLVKKQDIVAKEKLETWLNE